MLSVVRCYYTECDRGEPQLATAASWQADAEPRPAMIDAWSRGAGACEEARTAASAAGGCERPRLNGGIALAARRIALLVPAKIARWGQGGRRGPLRS